MPLIGPRLVDVNSREVERYLRELIDKPKRLGPALKKCEVEMLRMVADNFQDEGYPKGSWPRYKGGDFATQRRDSRGRFREFVRGKLLQKKRNLYWSYHPNRPGSLTTIDAIGANVTVGSNLLTPGGEYSLAAIHEYGAPRANIPPRPVGTWRPDRVDNCAQILSDALEKR